MDKISINVSFVDDPRLGIMVYHNALPEELRLVERLENTIGDSSTKPYMWMEALVGHSEKIPEYRNCYDCKMSSKLVDTAPPEFAELKNIWNDTVSRLVPCLNHYQQMHNIKMDYMEAINYVRYNEGEHFSYHADHGFSYVCTISSIMYLNDGYEGGELAFSKLGIQLEPQYGDIVIFPSTYIYTHASLPVRSGTKYSAVTMFDYNDNNHIKENNSMPSAEAYLAGGQ
jgi:hypothetical protein